MATQGDGGWLSTCWKMWASGDPVIGKVMGGVEDVENAGYTGGSAAVDVVIDAAAAGVPWLCRPT